MFRQPSQDRFSFAFVLAGVMAWTMLALTQVYAQEKPQTQPGSEPQWGQQAEQTFRIGRGMGRQLMTQEEWQGHHQRMRHMTATEREQYRQEWHAKMQERAKEKGITLPDTPGQGGRGMGRHGMGPGRHGRKGGRK